MKGKDWFLKLCEAAAGHAQVGNLAAAKYALDQAEHVLHNSKECNVVSDRHYLERALCTYKKYGGSY